MVLCARLIDYSSATCSSDRAGLGGNLGPELGALLGDGASDVLSLHVSLLTDDNTGVVYLQTK